MRAFPAQLDGDVGLVRVGLGHHHRSARYEDPLDGGRPGFTPEVHVDLVPGRGGYMLVHHVVYESNRTCTSLGVGGECSMRGPMGEIIKSLDLDTLVAISSRHQLV